MKSKFLFGLVAMMVVLALAPSSFAQVNIQIFPQTSPQEIQTSRDAQTGDPASTGAGLLVSGAVIANAPLTTTSLFIDYPGVLTSSGACVRRGPPPASTAFGAADEQGRICPSVPTTDPLRIEGATGLFSGATISSINYGTGVVEITMPGTQGSGEVAGQGSFGSGSFRLVGARLDVNGLTAPVTAVYTLSSTSNNYILSTSSGTVINALGAGLGGLSIGTRSSTAASFGSGLSIFTNRTTGSTGVSFILPEGFTSAYRTAAQLSTDSTPTTGRTVANSTTIRLTFTGVQSPMSIALTLSTPGTITAALSNGTITATANTTVISFTATSLSTTETIQVNASLAAIASGSAFTAGPIQVTATLVPIAGGLTSANQPNQADGYPVFAQADLGPLTIGSVVAPTTTMLIPYVVADLGFDTGIAIANTSADPFGGPANGGATAGGGPMVVSFYGRNSTGATPTVVTLTTSATVRPGAGLDSSGNLNSGSTWTVLLSELRTAAGQTGSFTGYVFIQAPFLNAHGSSFISDFRSFTSYSNVLIVPPPNSTSRSGPALESLGN